MDLVLGQACSLCHHVKAQRLQPLLGRTQQHARLHPVQQPSCIKRKLHRQQGKKGCWAVEGSPAAIAAEPSSSSVASNVSFWHCCSRRWRCTSLWPVLFIPFCVLRCRFARQGSPRAESGNLTFPLDPSWMREAKRNGSCSYVMHSDSSSTQATSPTTRLTVRRWACRICLWFSV